MKSNLLLPTVWAFVITLSLNMPSSGQRLSEHEMGWNRPAESRATEMKSVVNIGNGTELPGSPRSPIDFYWKSSLSETIYFADEIGLPAGYQVTKIGYYADFSETLSDKNIKVYMGETTSTDLSSGWITSAELTKVFDGKVTFLSGKNQVIIPLNTHYTYQGKNLVIMTYREKDTTIYSITNRFYSSLNPDHSARTLAIALDPIETYTLYPTNPPIHLLPMDHFPNITLYIIPGSNAGIYATGFESFDVPGQIACQEPMQWTTWDLMPCGEKDAEATTDFAHSGSKSAKVQGTTDLILPLGNKTTGKYEFSFQLYIPAGFCGYYNLLQDFNSSTSMYGLEVYFPSNGEGFLNANGYSTATFNYSHDQWISVKNIIDLNNDAAELIIDGETIHGWQWSAGATGLNGIRQISAGDFFAGTSEDYPTDIPLYYIDDLEYKALNAPTCEDLEISPGSVSQLLMSNTTASRTLTLTNKGNTSHNYNVVLDYASKQEAAPGHKRSTVYYDQTGNPSAETGIISQTFVTDLPTRICAAADDFIVPSGETWNISHVFAAGEYVNYVIHGEVPFVDVVFYADAMDFPGEALFTYDSIAAHSDVAGDVNIFLPSPATLTAGTYWVSVAAHMSYSTMRYWYWSRQASPTILNEFAWKNPPGGLSTQCITWCYGSTYQPDKVDRNLTFALSDSVYTIPEDWITVTPMNGTVPPLGSADLTMTIDATNITGNHLSTISIVTDDDVTPVKQVPVSMRIQGEPGQMPLNEGWDPGFLANEWELDPVTIQWNVNTANGNPKPEVWYFRPVNVLDYSFSLVTRPLDAREIDDNVTLEYEVKFQNPSTVETLECLSSEVYDGKNWQVLFTHKNTQRGFEYTRKKFNITPYVAGKIFNVRFRVHGANTSNFNVWEMDNIKIYRQEVGNIAGTVTRFSDGSPVNDGAVTISNPQSGVYSAQTGGGGSYSIIGAEAGTYLLSIKKEGFNVLYDSITILYDQTITKNYALTYSILSVDPASLTATVPVGLTTEKTVTLHNGGNGPLAWIGSFQSNTRSTSIPKSNGDFPKGASAASLDRAPVKASATTEPIRGIKGSTAFAFDLWSGNIISFDMDDPGTPLPISTFKNGTYAGTFDAYNTDFMYIIDNSNDHLSKVDMTTGAFTDIGKCYKVSGHTWTGLEIDKTTNILYAVSSIWSMTESQLYTIDMNTGTATQVGNLGINACIDIAIDGSGQMYGYDISTDNAYKIDKTTAVSTLLGSIGFDANFAQGMSWDPVNDIIYLTAYNNWTESGELRILDRVSGNTEYIGNLRGETDALAFPGGSSTWFSLEPSTGLIEAGGSQTVNIIFDGSYINEDENPTVTGKLVLKPDVSISLCDPASVDLTMTIQGPLFGTLNGIITHNDLPLDGVTVTAVRQNSPIDYTYSMTTATDGMYAFNTVLYGEYTLIVQKTGYNSYSFAGLVVTGDQTTTHDVSLLAPVMNVNPTEINATASQGESVTRTITITNSGDGPMDWQSYISAIVGRISIPRSDGKFPRSNTPPSAGPAPSVNHNTSGKANNLPRGSLAYGFELGDPTRFFSFDTDDPTLKNFIGPVDFLAVGADFDSKHTDFMYVIDYDNFELKKIYLETGEVESIGPCIPREEHIWTGIAVNKLTNVLYGVSSNMDGSALYTIDMNTGEATDLGDIGMPGAIDCAIDGSGTMYSYCIVNKESYSINLETLETTYLGPIGFDANYAQGMAWDPSTDIIYLSAFNQEAYAGELRILDRITGNTLLLGTFNSEVDGLAFPGLLPWFTVDPRNGTIEPWSEQEMTVTMHGDLAFSIKDYILSGNIRLESDPDVGMIDIPVTLTVTPVGMNTPDDQNRITVYPNPAGDYVYIKSDQMMRSVEVLSLTGQVVHAESVLHQKEFKLDLHTWPQGVYLLKLITDQGVRYSQITVTH